MPAITAGYICVQVLMHLMLQAKQGVSDGSASAILDNTPPLQISIKGKDCHMKMNEVICMPVQEYDALWPPGVMAL